MKLTDPQEQPDKNERDIRRIMVVGTAIGAGCMAATLEALRASPSGFTFEVSLRTFMVFVLGAALMVPFWRIAFGLGSGNGIRGRHVLAGLLILGLGIAAFLYPLRFVPASVRPDLFIGFILAVCALTVLGFLLVRVVKFFESDHAKGPDSDKSHG